MKTTIIIKALLLAPVAGLFTACTSMQSPFIVGDAMEFSEAEVGKQLSLQVGEEVVWIKLVDAQTFLAARMEWESDRTAFGTQSAEVILSRMGDAILLNYKPEDLDRYIIYRVGRSSSREYAMAFGVDPAILATHKEKGLFNGTEKEGEFILDGTKEEIDQYVARHLKDLFTYAEGIDIVFIAGDEIEGFPLYVDKGRG